MSLYNDTEQETNMAKVDPPPPPDEMDKRRRQAPLIVDASHITKEGEIRARQWAMGMVKKNLDKCNGPDVPEGNILASGEVEPEALDVRAAYPFSDLRWIIFKRKQMLHLTLLSDHKAIFTASYIDV